MNLKIKLFIALILTIPLSAICDDGYRLWLKYDPISDNLMLNEYRKSIKGYMVLGESPTIDVIKAELQNGLSGLLDRQIPASNTFSDHFIIAGKTDHDLLKNISLSKKYKNISSEDYFIVTTELENKKVTIISSNGDIGLLYGVFHFLKILQTHQSIENLDIVESPGVKLRLLNHWDNLQRLSLIHISEPTRPY